MLNISLYLYHRIGEIATRRCDIADIDDEFPGTRIKSLGEEVIT